MTDLQALLEEKKVMVAIAQFVRDMGMVAQFAGVGTEAMGMYEIQESNERDTDLETCTNVQAGDVSARSAHPSVMTNNSTNTSLGSIQSTVSVDGDVP
jgi:hypothetical protein